MKPDLLTAIFYCHFIAFPEKSDFKRNLGIIVRTVMQAVLSFYIVLLLFPQFFSFHIVRARSHKKILGGEI